MKIEIFDTKEFIDINKLQEVTSPIVFQRGGVPDPDGLLSTRIFGIDVNSRRTHFAYIDLNSHFFQPHVYKALKRLFRNVDYIVNGAKYYRIDADGKLVEDSKNGETGIEFLYKNWEKIKWGNTEEGSNMRNERINLLTKSKKNEIFTRYMIVIPVMYRDVVLSNSGGETDPLNNLYSKLIRLKSLLKNKDMFDFTFHSTNFNIQNIMVEIYDTFKHKIERKNGMIRKYLMGKNVDNCIRSVISAPHYRDETPEDTGTKFGHVGVPLAQVCSLCYPFIQVWLRNFFEREFIQVQEGKPVRNTKTGEVEYIKLYKPELYFTDKYIKSMVDLFIRDPESRFKPIQVPVGKDEFKDVMFTGKKIDLGDSDLSTISNRPMTVTDILYMAAHDVTHDKHGIVTRYPVSDAYGIFVAKINVVSTMTTEVVKINETIYNHYPKIELGLKPADVLLRFVDAMQFSNSYLAGIGGDYDGDQVTLKILWTQEANLECARVMNAKSFFIRGDGSNARPIKFECPQTMYDLTKAPLKTNKQITGEERDRFVQMDPKKLTFSFFTNTFADRMLDGKVVKSPYEPNDIIILKPNEWFNKETITTTLGRLLWNKFMIDRVGLREFFPYNNDVLVKKVYGKYENAVVLLLREDKIDTTLFRNYIEHRDWLGLQIHSLITSSFTPKTVKTPAVVQAKKKELFKKYEKELKDGDIVVANKIEKELIGDMVKEIQDDPGYNLYASGARGDINNHLKNIFIMRGGVANPNSGKFDIMTTAFMDGLKKEDFTAASNSVVQGAYPKAVGTADSGYLAKQLMAGMQTEVVGDANSDCGTTKTIDFVLDEYDTSEFNYRYISEGGKPVLIKHDNIGKYVGKRIKLFSPMCCIGVNGKLCEKCAGKIDSKFVGLDSNAVATTLTNLNMKKFHDSTIRLYNVDPNDILINHSKDICMNDGTNIILTDDYFEMYIPTSYFDKLGLAEDMGNKISLFGLVTVGIFNNGKFDHFDTWNIPSWHTYNTFDTELREIEIPGMGKSLCKVLKYLKGHQICASNIIEDALNAQLFLRQVNYGKVPNTIPYTASLGVWRKNQKMNNVNFGVPSVILEVILATMYRYKKDPNMKFATVFGKDPNISEYDYEMGSIRRICQVTSTFTGITFESFDEMVTTSVNRARDKGNETESPLEMLFKL